MGSKVTWTSAGCREAITCAWEEIAGGMYHHGCEPGAKDLAEARRQLAEAERLAKFWADGNVWWRQRLGECQNSRDKLSDDLAEAAEAVRLLIAWAKHAEFVMKCNDVKTCSQIAVYGLHHRDWDNLPAWLRRKIAE